LLAILAVTLVRARYTRVFVALPWSVALLLCAYVLAGPAAGERQLVVASAILTVCEVAIVAGLATFFASFSTPFLTAVLTLLVFLVGRSADTLAKLPEKMFGKALHDMGRGAAHVFPNLHVYVPPRPLLLGQVPDKPVWPYVGEAAAHAVFYATGLLVLSAVVFRKRDFL
jgi:hypothetical protein